MSIKALQDYTFVSRYARYDKDKKRRETWDEAVERVKQMHLRRYPQVREDIEWAFARVSERRAVGSQRALQFGGRPIESKHARLYNCLAKETNFITSQGVRSFVDFKDGDECVVLTHRGNWKRAVVRCYGKQKLHRITISRGHAKYRVRATNNHRWLLKDGTISQDISEQDQLMFAPNIAGKFVYEESNPLERLYWAYGYIYGDGTSLKDSQGEYKYSHVRLCGEKVKYLERFQELGFKDSTSASLKGDVMVSTGKYLKTLPDPKVDSPALICAFVHGYLAADGTKNSNARSNIDNRSPSPYKTIQATGEDSVRFIRECFPIAGIYIVSERDLSGQITNYGRRKTPTVLFHVISGFGQTAHSFTVTEISDKGEVEDVWCLEVEDDQSFVLPNGLVTGNCITSYCDRLRFFQEAAWLLLCGCGVGFSVQKHHVAKLPAFSSRKNCSKKVYVVPDSIEGWADAIGVLLSSYFNEPIFPEYANTIVQFDYSQVRPAGSPLGSCCGKAPGPRPLRNSLEKIRAVLNRCVDMGQTYLRPIDAYDLVMHASDAVLSGGIRRSATICLFSRDDNEMLNAKIGNWFYENPQRARSNNSVILLRDETTREQFDEIMKSVKEFGEPGFLWTDSTEMVVNPCCEISMYPVDENTGKTGWQACNLTEINGGMVKTKEDFAVAARAASIIGTLQAGYTDFPYLGETSETIIRREALLGVSITGVMENAPILLDPTTQQEMAEQVLMVNHAIAKEIGINPCARATCIKPSGTASCILGTSSGIHPHHWRRYLRRVQSNKMEEPLQYFQTINPSAVENSVWSANGTDAVITFCVDAPRAAHTKGDMSAVKLLSAVKTTQQNWVRHGTNLSRCTKPWLIHNVSNTCTVKDCEWGEVSAYIYDNRQFFAGISLLPETGDLDYQQAPMVAILTAEELVNKYGPGCLLASGLIVDGLSAFGNLWVACDAAMCLGEYEHVVSWSVHNPCGPFENVADFVTWKENKDRNDLKKDWIRRARQFAERYFNNDVRHMCYCLKQVSLYKTWLDLRREYKPVDYTQCLEEEDNTKLAEEIACAGGRCDIL